MTAKPLNGLKCVWGLSVMKNKISPKASIYGNLKLGDNIRIDDFCIITGDVEMKGYNHIGPFVHLSGTHGILLEEFSSLGAHSAVLSNSDDYSGLSMSNPMVPDECKPGLVAGKITLRKHVLCGAHVIIMPGVTIGEGCSVGAFTFVNKDLEPWGIYAGIPARRIKERSKKMLEIVEEFERSKGNYRHLFADHQRCLKCGKRESNGPEIDDCIMSHEEAEKERLKQINQQKHGKDYAGQTFKDWG